MMEQPLISVIVPVYKVEPYLRQCVDSIINQTYKNLEIILIDDGSPDKCPEICDEYAAKDSRVRVIHQKNSGVSAARNAGLDSAHGEMIMFVDGDDWLDDEMIEKLHRNIEDCGSDIAVCSVMHSFPSEERNQPEFFHWSSDVINGTEMCRGVLFAESGDHGSVCHKLIKRTAWEDLRFDPGKKLGEDFWAALHLMIKDLRWSLVNEPLYYVRHRDSGASGSNDYLTHSKSNYELAKQCVELFDVSSDYYNMGVEFLIVRFFVFTNYAAANNEKFSFTETRRDFLLYDKQIQTIIHSLSGKYRYGYKLLKHFPNLFWAIIRARMLRITTK